MNISLNGEQKTISGIHTVTDLLNDLTLIPGSVVVELNNEIIQPDSYDAAVLADQDRIEIIRFVGGG